MKKVVNYCDICGTKMDSTQPAAVIETSEVCQKYTSDGLVRTLHGELPKHLDLCSSCSEELFLFLQSLAKLKNPDILKDIEPRDLSSIISLKAHYKTMAEERQKHEELLNASCEENKIKTEGFMMKGFGFDSRFQVIPISRCEKCKYYDSSIPNIDARCDRIFCDFKTKMNEEVKE